MACAYLLPARHRRASIMHTCLPRYDQNDTNFTTRREEQHFCKCTTHATCKIAVHYSGILQTSRSFVPDDHKQPNPVIPVKPKVRIGGTGDSLAATR